jgi:hypothetical protein
MQGRAPCERLRMCCSVYVLCVCAVLCYVYVCAGVCVCACVCGGGSAWNCCSEGCTLHKPSSSCTALHTGVGMGVKVWGVGLREPLDIRWHSRSGYATITLCDLVFCVEHSFFICYHHSNRDGKGLPAMHLLVPCGGPCL